MANNLDKPTMEAQAASIARLGECPGVIGDPALRAFVVRIMEMVEELRAQDAQGRQGTEERVEEEQKKVIFKVSLNEQSSGKGAI